MRNLKKLLAILLAATMLFSFGSIASAAAIKDAPDAADAASVLAKYGTDLEETYTKAVQLMVDLGVVAGDDKGNLNLGKIYNRAEFAALLYKSMNGGKSIAASYQLQTPFFKDVPATHWAVGYANWGGTTGLFAGYGDGLFGPDDKITFEQGLLVTMKALGLNTKSEGLDGLAWGGPAEAMVRNLAFNTKLLGDLVSLDGKYLNRAEAFLLGQYFIFAEQIKYSVITGERYRTGDSGVVGSWGDQNNPSSTLFSTAFNGAIRKVDILSDGQWFALSDISTYVGDNNVAMQFGGFPSLDRNGKAVIGWSYYSYDFGWSYTYDVLSEELTKELGITFEDVGRNVELIYSMDRDKFGNIQKVFRPMEYQDSIGTYYRIKGDGFAGDAKSLAGRSIVCKDLSFYANYTYVGGFTTTATSLGGKSLGGTGTTATWSNDNDYFRVIYNDVGVKYAFLEQYDYARFKEVSSEGRMILAAAKSGQTGGANNVKTSDIMGYEDAKLVKDSRFVTYKIGSLYGIKAVVEPQEGRVTAVTDANQKVAFEGTTYSRSTVSASMNGTLFNAYVSAGTDATAWIFNGFVCEIMGAPAAPANYCVVLKSSYVADTTGFNNPKYRVNVLYEDGTTEVRDIYDIVKSTGVKTASENTYRNSSSTNTPGAGQWSATTTTGASVYFNGDGAGVFANANGAKNIDGHIFAYEKPNGTSIKLFEVDAVESGAVNGDNGKLPGSEIKFSSEWDVAGGLVLGNSTVVLVKNGTNGYKSYKNTVPTVSVSAGRIEVLKMKLNDENNVASNGNAARLVYAEGTGVTGTASDWVVAVDGIGNYINPDTGAKRHGIRVIFQDGSLGMLYSNDDNTTRFNGLSRGDVFSYTGPNDAVDSVSAKEYTEGMGAYNTRLDSNQTDARTFEISQHDNTAKDAFMRYRADAKLIVIDVGRDYKAPYAAVPADIDFVRILKQSYEPSADKPSFIAIDYFLDNDGYIAGAVLRLLNTDSTGEVIVPPAPNAAPLTTGSITVGTGVRYLVLKANTGSSVDPTAANITGQGGSDTYAVVPTTNALPAGYIIVSVNGGDGSATDVASTLTFATDGLFGVTSFTLEYASTGLLAHDFRLNTGAASNYGLFIKLLVTDDKFVGKATTALVNIDGTTAATGSGFFEALLSTTTAADDTMTLKANWSLKDGVYFLEIDDASYDNSGNVTDVEIVDTYYRAG